MIDIVLRKDIPKPYLIMAQLALHDLDGGNVIFTNTMKEALKESKSEFICFIGNGVMNHLAESLKYFADHKNFIKLAMLSPVVSDITTKHKIYGYTVKDKGVTPVLKRNSTEPYPVQVGSLAGAIIRRNVLDAVADNFTGNMIFDSYALSIHLWLTNRMVYINPNSLYVAEDLGLHKAIEFKQDPMKGNSKMKDLKDKWKKEAI